MVAGVGVEAQGKAQGVLRAHRRRRRPPPEARARKRPPRHSARRPAREAPRRRGVMAGVRSRDLTGIHRFDEVAALAGGAHVAGTSGDLTGLRRGEDAAGQLAALRDAMRGGGAGPQREVRSVSRVPGLDDTASVHEASAPDIVADIRSGATVPDLDAPVLHSTVSPPQPPPGVKHGLLGGARPSASAGGAGVRLSRGPSRSARASQLLQPPRQSRYRPRVPACH